jgi:hypothetical protein
MIPDQIAAAALPAQTPSSGEAEARVHDPSRSARRRRLRGWPARARGDRAAILADNDAS